LIILPGSMKTAVKCDNSWELQDPRDS